MKVEAMAPNWGRLDRRSCAGLNILQSQKDVLRILRMSVRCFRPGNLEIKPWGACAKEVLALQWGGHLPKFPSLGWNFRQSHACSGVIQAIQPNALRPYWNETLKHWPHQDHITSWLILPMFMNNFEGLADRGKHHSTATRLSSNQTWRAGKWTIEINDVPS